MRTIMIQFEGKDPDAPAHTATVHFFGSRELAVAYANKTNTPQQKHWSVCKLVQDFNTPSNAFETYWEEPWYSD